MLKVAFKDLQKEIYIQCS